MIGGACGALVAVWGTRALVSLAPLNLPRRETIAVDWRIAAVVVGVGTLLGLLAGSLPAVWSTRAQLATLLRNVAVRGGGGYGRCAARWSSRRWRSRSCCSAPAASWCGASRGCCAPIRASRRRAC
jgi:hypothetical protein